MGFKFPLIINDVCKSGAWRAHEMFALVPKLLLAYLALRGHMDKFACSQRPPTILANNTLARHMKFDFRCDSQAILANMALGGQIKLPYR